ncbi:DUF192 domain-containing protein [Candidatus Uhrbacteria bacterium]|nr:DUF192 domain-containing protein [Candidatus Uhrbacteria bacterium]
MNIWKSWFAIGGILILMIIGLYAYHAWVDQYSGVRILLNGQSLLLKISDTTSTRSLGLSDRDSMPLDQGMLFLFDDSDVHPFWMNRMRFPLDIIWLDHGKVVYIAENVPFPIGKEKPKTIDPKVVSDRVLELNAGQAKFYGLEVGSVIQDLP